MFKKLLVAVLALTIIVGLFSPALATKNPNEAKRLLNQTLPPGPLKNVIVPQSEIPTSNPATSPTRHTAPPGLVVHKPGAPCSDQSCVGAIAYYWDAVPGAAMKYTAAGECTLKTFSMDFYSGGVTPAAAGITVYVWNDNGLGLPGSVIYSVNVPNGSMVYYPTPLQINLAPQNIVFSNTTYLAGYVENDFTDSYRPLTDAGATGDCSRYYDNVTAAWYTMLEVTNPATDFNFSMVMNSCCGTGGGGQDCHGDVYDNGVYYRWSDRLPKAVKFTATNACTLITAKVNISTGGQLGTGGIDIKVYGDAAGYPGALLATKHVAHGSIVLPGETVVDMSSFNLVFTGNYYIAYEITNPVTDDYELRSDDGLAGNNRSLLDTLDAGGNPGFWAYGSALFAPDDYNWMIRDSVCCSTAPPVCWTESYFGAPTFYWPLPDVYGDDFFNTRFSAATKCTIKSLNFGFYAAGSVGNPGATVYLWKSDGTFPMTPPTAPTSVIYSVPVNPVVNYFPLWTKVDVSAFNIVRTGDFHIGYSPIVLPGEKLAILSDDGSTATGRSSEYYNGAFSSMLTDWGVDAAFYISVDKCCQPPGYCDIFCDPTDQWPTFAHDYARTSESGIKLGDVCGVVNAWIYTGNNPTSATIDFTAPLIVGDKVYISFASRMVCLDLQTKAEIWNTTIGLHCPSVRRVGWWNA